MRLFEGDDENNNVQARPLCAHATRSGEPSRRANGWLYAIQPRASMRWTAISQPKMPAMWLELTPRQIPRRRVVHDNLVPEAGAPIYL